VEDDFICDDRDQLEVIQMVNSMTDEEFAEYIESLNQSKTND